MRKLRTRRTFYYWLGRFPPCLVRLLARFPHGPPLRDEEIALYSGLPVYQVLVLSQMPDWSGVDVGTVQRFTHGCGLDLDDPVSIKRKIVYLSAKNTRVGRFRYLRRSPQWETLYKPLIQKWRLRIETKTQPNQNK